MPITLLVRSGGAQGTQAPLSMTFDQPRIVVGRGEGCDLRLPDLSVSHRHASIRQRGAEYILVDEASTNGTFFGSVRLHEQSPRMVRHGELFRIGRVWIEARIEQCAATAHPAQATREIALALVAAALDAEGESARPRLVVVEGPDQGRHLDLSDVMRPMVLGRGREADMALEHVDASRRHAQVTRKADVLLVRDLGSKNGTHTEQGPVPVDSDATVRVGEWFSIGPDKFVFEFGAMEALKEIERASDEPLDPKERITPPDATAGQEPAPAKPKPHSERPPPADVIFPDPPPPSSNSAEAPGSRAARQQKAGGWNRTDIAVGLLALVVLGLSAIGLIWLFRGG
jgi:pSer/pThr/pTyr-binding forkhead associated (FHA) protein